MLNFDDEMQYAAGTKCNDSVRTGRVDGAVGGYKLKGQ